MIDEMFKRVFFSHIHTKALKSLKMPNKKLTQLIVNVHGKELYQYQCLSHKSHLRTLLYADRKYLGLFIVSALCHNFQFSHLCQNLQTFSCHIVKIFEDVPHSFNFQNYNWRNFQSNLLKSCEPSL